MCEINACSKAAVCHGFSGSEQGKKQTSNRGKTTTGQDGAMEQLETRGLKV
jgi:hypothetical protein